MILDARIADFVAWFGAYQERVGAALEARLVQPRAELALTGTEQAKEVVSLAAVRATGTTGSWAQVERTEMPENIAWSTWLEDQARPPLLELRAVLQKGGDGTRHFDAFAKELREAIARLPEHIALYTRAATTDTPEPGDDATADVPVRRWFEALLFPRTLPLLEDLERAVEAGTADSLREVDRIEKVLDYYLLSVLRHSEEGDEQQETEEFARSGLERSRTLLDGFEQRQRRAAAAVRLDFVARSSALLEDACAPLRAHRPAEIERRLEALADEHTRGPSLRARMRGSIAAAYRATAPLVRLVHDLREIIEDRDRAPAQDRWFRLLTSDLDARELVLPPTYRRLFSTIPLQIADIYVPRPDAEAACARLLEGWRSGSAQSLLVHGDRGAGKRTFVNQMLAAVRNQLPVHWVRLSAALEREDDVSRAIATARRMPPANDFAALATELGKRRSRAIIVIENVERLFKHSTAGLARVRDFLRAVAITSPNTLWILLAATPAATLLLQRAELAHRPTTVLALPGLDATGMRTMIMRRHELSGFDVLFKRRRVRALERLRHPIAATRTLASPADDWFLRMFDLTRGNPRQAQYMWLLCAHTESRRPHHIVVDALPRQGRSLLHHTVLEQQMLLAALAQLGSATLEDLCTALAVPEGRVRTDLDGLCALGLAVRDERHGLHWSLAPVVAHPLTLELRARNMV